jgi:hypothetical protein
VFDDEHAYVLDMEYFLLMEFATIPYTQQRDIEHILQNFLNSYYGIERMPDSYVVPTVVAREDIVHLLPTEEEVDVGIQEWYIARNLERMNEILERVSVSEAKERYIEEHRYAIESSQSQFVPLSPMVKAGGKKRKTRRATHKKKRTRKHARR